MKVLANDGLGKAGIELLEKSGFQVITDGIDQDQLIDGINSNNIEALLVRSATKVRQNLIDSCPGLKLIGRGGVGMDNIDVEYARSKGIAVVNTPAASSQSVAELVFAHIFALARSLHDANKKMPVEGNENFKALKKKYGKGFELRGKTIGILGFGRIGQSVAKYALGCGMKVIAYDAFPVNVEIPVEIHGHGTVNVKIPMVSKEELIKESDIISLHIPAQDSGQAVIGKEEISQMKDGVVLVNAARGGVVDEEALLEALNSGKIGSAGLDVFENEPTPKSDLLKNDKISLSPHIGAATKEAQDRISIEMAEQIIAHFN